MDAINMNDTIATTVLAVIEVPSLLARHARAYWTMAAARASNETSLNHANQQQDDGNHQRIWSTIA
jgi:hypothetical protein